METAIVAGVFGVLGTAVGVAIGRYLDQWLRHRGDVHCQIRSLPSLHDSRIHPPPFRVDRRVGVHFFNEKEVNTGLSEITVVFVNESGEETVLGPKTRDYDTSTSPRGVINLPSKTWVTTEISGTFYGSQVQHLPANPKAIEVKGKFPDGKPYHKKGLEPPNERRH